MERTREPSLPDQVLMELSLGPKNTSLTAFAKRTGISDSELSALVHGSMPVTQDMALRLARAMNTAPELWLSLLKCIALRIANHENKSLNLPLGAMGA